MKQSKAEQTKTTKLFVLSLALLLVFASGCMPGSYKFKYGLKEMDAIDAKYGTSMYSESLDAVMLNFEDVVGINAELDLFKAKLEGMRQTDDIKALLLLVEYRKQMLDSQNDIIKVRYIGTKGQIMDGFRCKEKEYIMNASQLYRSAVNKKVEASGILSQLTVSAVAAQHINEDNISFESSDTRALWDLYKAGEYIYNVVCVNESGSSA